MVESLDRQYPSGIELGLDDGKTRRSLRKAQVERLKNLGVRPEAIQKWWIVPESVVSGESRDEAAVSVSRETEVRVSEAIKHISVAIELIAKSMRVQLDQSHANNQAIQSYEVFSRAPTLKVVDFLRETQSPNFCRHFASASPCVRKYVSDLMQLRRGNDVVILLDNFSFIYQESHPYAHEIFSEVTRDRSYFAFMPFILFFVARWIEMVEDRPTLSTTQRMNLSAIRKHLNQV